jgi:hypothetical protein
MIHRFKEISTDFKSHLNTIEDRAYTFLRGVLFMQLYQLKSHIILT